MTGLGLRAGGPCSFPRSRVPRKRVRSRGLRLFCGLRGAARARRKQTLFYRKQRLLHSKQTLLCHEQRLLHSRQKRFYREQQLFYHEQTLFYQEHTLFYHEQRLFYQKHELFAWRVRIPAWCRVIRREYVGVNAGEGWDRR